MSSSSAPPETDKHASKLRIVLVIALMGAYPVASYWALADGGLVGETALWAGALPQVFCYLGLLWLFGRSLFADRQALVTRMARFVHGSDLPADIERYTRQVTILWSLFFAIMIVVSLVLLLFVSVESWLFFANVLNLPLVVGVFVGEYGYRWLRFPDFAHVSLAGSIRAFRRFRGLSDGE